MKKIGFVGTGIMGKSMVRNLMKQGFQVSVYTRTKKKAEPLIKEGAIWCDSLSQCVKGRDAVITIVGYPKDVEEVYFGEKGILGQADKGSYVIDMTTTSPVLSERIYKEALGKGLHALDAPVTGGDTGARLGSLSILAGGDREAFDACLDIFKAVGKNITYMGKAGMGQHAKMANQIIIAGTMAGVSEAMAYAQRTGLDKQTLLDAVSGGAAASFQLRNMGPRMLRGDFSPGFFIKHFIKDMGIAKEEAEKRKLRLKVLNQVLSMYEEMEKKGKGELGTQALVQYYD